MRFRKENVFQLRAMREALEPTLALLDGEERTPRARLGPLRHADPRIARAAAGSRRWHFAGAPPKARSTSRRTCE